VQAMCTGRASVIALPLLLPHELPSLLRKFGTSDSLMGNAIANADGRMRWYEAAMGSAQSAAIRTPTGQGTRSVRLLRQRALQDTIAYEQYWPGARCNQQRASIAGWRRSFTMPPRSGL